MTQNGCCLYCKCSFLRSPYRPQQAVCSRLECTAGDAPTITDASAKEIWNIVRSPTTARRSGARLIPTIFRAAARNIRKPSNGIANAGNGGTKSAASGGLKRTFSFGPKAFCRRGLDGGAKGSQS